MSIVGGEVQVPGAQPGLQVDRVLQRVPAKGLVVEADDRVVRARGGLQHREPRRCRGEHTVATDGGLEGAVDEEQDPGRAAGRQLHLAQVVDGRPALHVLARHQDQAGMGVPFQEGHDRTGNDARGEGQHIRLQPADDNIAEWPERGSGPRAHPGRCGWSHVDLEPDRRGMVNSG